MVKQEQVETPLQREDENTEDKSVKRVKLEKPSVDEDLQAKIAKQVDYYFSDVNFVKDKFLQDQFEKNDNTVKLSVLATFSRLAQMTTDEDVMIQALKNYVSEFFELDEEKKLVRRKKPLPDRDEFKKSLELKTVHISGFPDTTPFEALQKFCSQYGDLESLSMRKHFKTKQFKGCIHVVYKDEADAKKVLDTDDLKFKDRELRRESMEQYHKRKEEIRAKIKKSKKGGDS